MAESNKLDAAQVSKLNAKDADEQTTQDLTEFVQSLLQKMHERFQEMSDSIIGRCMYWWLYCSANLRWL